MRLREGLTVDDLRRGGIYRIRNTVNGRVYIGQASSEPGIIRRHSHHKWALSKERHDNRHLQKSWNKYGPEAFEFSIVVYCADRDLTTNEQAALDGVPVELRYNQVGPVDSPNLGRRFSAEHRAKIGARHQGKVFSEETRRKMSASAKNRPPMTGAQKSKIAQGSRGRKHSAEGRARMRVAQAYKRKQVVLIGESVRHWFPTMEAAAMFLGVGRVATVVSAHSNGHCCQMHRVFYAEEIRTDPRWGPFESLCTTKSRARLRPTSKT